VLVHGGSSLVRELRHDPDADPLFVHRRSRRHPARTAPQQRSAVVDAHLIHQAAPPQAPTFVHIGTGTGYYTAVMLTCWTIRPGHRIDMSPNSPRGPSQFAGYPNVDLSKGSGARFAFDEAVCIYVRPRARRHRSMAIGLSTEACAVSCDDVDILGSLRIGFGPRGRFGLISISVTRPDGPRGSHDGGVIAGPCPIMHDWAACAGAAW